MSVNQVIIDQTLDTPQGAAAYGVVETLTDAGFDTWWVGGCVRDMVLGTAPKDIDIASAASPEEITKLFEKFDDSAKDFGTVRVTLKGITIELTTFREDDSASDGRHPESVVFGKREADARRRDFTINAMYFHPISRELYDPFNGQNDLKERLIRFIEDPAIRIKHDALRLMRAVRFRALIGGQYHPETYHALKENAQMIEALSGTRRFEELEKMLMGSHPDRALEDLWETGILNYILPELYECKGIAQPADYHHEGDVWDHTMKVLRSFREEDSIDTRIAALFHDCGKAKTFSFGERAGYRTGVPKLRIRFDEHASVSGTLTEEALHRLQCPKRRREKIVWLVKHHMMMGTFTDQDLSEERKAHWYYHPYFPELLQVFYLDIAGTDPSDYSMYDHIQKNYHTFLDTHPRPPKSLLTGDEVMEILQIDPGAKVGEMLRMLYDKQLSKDVTTKKEAESFLRSL